MRDAYQLVVHLQNRGYQTSSPPPEPLREYVCCRSDLQAVVEQLRKVREWLGETAKVKGAPSAEVTKAKNRRRARANAGRKPSPEIAKRNRKAVRMFTAGSSVEEVCERLGISAALARRIKSDAGLKGDKVHNKAES